MVTSIQFTATFLPTLEFQIGFLNSFGKFWIPILFWRNFPNVSTNLANSS